MAPSRAGDANFYSRIRSFWFKSPCVLSLRLFPTLSRAVSFTFPTARFRSTCAQCKCQIIGCKRNPYKFDTLQVHLPPVAKKKRRKVCVKGELFYTLAKRARWRCRKEMEMTALAPAVVVAVLHREKHWSFMRLQKKKKASRKLTRNLLLSEPLQICLSCFNKSRISYSHLVHYYKFHIAVHCLMPLAVSRQFRHRNQTSLVSDTRVPMVWGSCQAEAFKRATFA